MDPHHRPRAATADTPKTSSETSSEPPRSPFFSKALRIGGSLGRASSAASKLSRNPSETKGPFGLTTLYQPGGDTSEVITHVVFVHGLGGGSERTWTKDSIFWPRDLLPLEDGYTNAAIHSFGYDSDFKASNILDISDFAKSLLGNMLDNPCILHSTCPMVLVGHSMGGLVIKRAYILARQGNFYASLVDRIRSIYFIATPHQGSDHAATLSKLFRTSPSLRPYLNDLQRSSDQIKAINEEFPVYSKDLILHSFYESRPLSIPGVGKKLIVEKRDAVLLYENERSELLNGDHRSICKFDTPEDSNYKTIHRALASTIQLLTTTRPESSHKPEVESLNYSELRNQVSDIFGSFEAQEDDLYRVTSERVSGTCEWLTENSDFDDWAYSKDFKMLWLRGPPAAGKSFVAGYAVEQLAEAGQTVCYYFFTHGDKTKSSISSFLLSMACQIAVRKPEVATLAERIVSKDPWLLEAGDHRAIWRKLWLQGILKSKRSLQDVVWVVDSLDECRADEDLLRIILRVQQSNHIKILITARKSHDDYDPPPRSVTHLSINTEDTQRDIAAYLDDHSPMLETNIRRIILEKSNGCFLWATLVLQRLRSVHGLKARLRAVQSEPPGMDNLYSRVLEALPDPQLSRIFLTWIVCCIRPLTVNELQYALTEFREDSNGNAIRELVLHQYHDLLFIDKGDQVRVRHSSVAEFLLRHDIDEHNQTRLTIDRAGGHKKIALTCIDYLSGPDMDSRSRRKMSVTRPSRSPFVAYASTCLYEHLNRSSAIDQDILTNLAVYLQSENILSWVEYLASSDALETVFQTAQALRDFLRRKSRRDLLLGNEVVVVDRWATDLVKLVTKFGRQLLLYPPSIFSLIPPFCPSESAPFEQFAQGRLGLSVQGLSATSWDDCICTIAPSEHRLNQNTEDARNLPKTALRRRRTSAVSQGERLRSLASTDRCFAIGTSMGRISIFNDRTCLEENVIEHPMAVNLLQFANNRPLLASASNRMIRIWNTETWQSQWDTRIPKECLALAFVDDDQILLAALRSTKLLVFDLVNWTQREIDWSKRLAERYGDRFRARSPTMATFQTDLDTLAVVYRGQDIVVWNYEDDTQRLYNHSQGLSDGSVDPMIQVNCLAFSNLPGSSLLVANYNVGNLVLFDTNAESIKSRLTTTEIYARLTSSPDGRTFAGAAVDGTIELYDFETLRKLYRIQSEDQGITFLAFTADSTRLLDIRGDRRSCRVWEPSALHRREIEKDSLRTPSLYSQETYDKALDRNDEHVPIVTSLAIDGTGDYFFVGKDCGTVSIIDS